MLFESTGVLIELLKTIKCHQNNMSDDIWGHQVHDRCSRFVSIDLGWNVSIVSLILIPKTF